MDLICESLNDQQKRAVTFDHTQALQVVAGPGTGKTKVLTSRVAYLLLEKKIKPGNIIVTTFTRKATNEMIERLEALLKGTGVNTKGLWIGTFHSICSRLLRQQGWKIELPKDWRTLSDTDVDPILQKLVEETPDQIRDYANDFSRKVNLTRPNNKNEWEVNPKMVKKNISKLKSEGLLVEEYKNSDDHDPALLHFYERYQSELQAQHALDYDDLLLYAFKLLTKERCLPHIQHVLVDEFQDTNGIQLDLMYLLARGRDTFSQGVTVVGDPDQSIYAFRNALSQNFGEMLVKCPLPCSQIVLVENYRSSQRILNTSDTLIRQQKRGRENRLPLRAQFDLAFPPVYITFPATFLESTALAREILYLRSLPNLWTYNDFAILVRQRRQIRGLEKALIEHRIPYKIVKGHAFWELKEINGMMDLLKVVYSDYEKYSILRALQYPARGLGKVNATRIEQLIPQYASPFETLQEISRCPEKFSFPSKTLTIVKDFVSLIESCRSLCKDAPNLAVLSDLFEKLYEGSGLRYEYLYVDGKKKADVDPEASPNLDNKRHKNLQILKSHLTSFKPVYDPVSPDGLSEEDETSDPVSKDGIKIEETTSPTSQHHSSTTWANREQRSNAPPTNDEELPVVDIQDVLRQFINSINLYSSEIESDELQKTEQERKESEAREKQGYVTISTIHGSKGLEWPVVMIPDVVEGIIPSVFFNDDNDDEDDSEATDEDVKDEKSKKQDNSKKYKTRKVEESLDEERRMFFVAQTRAKTLLYITATSSENTSDDRFNKVPSRFLTPELKQTMCDEQRVFQSLEMIKALYRSFKIPTPSNEDKFSLKTLIDDYNQFVNDRRERIVWRGTVIYDPTKLDISENAKISPSMFGVTTAASQLNRNRRSPSPRRASLGLSRHGSNQSVSPVRAGSTQNSLNRVHTRAPSYAPPIITSRAPTYAPSYAPPRTAPNNNTARGRSFAPRNTALPLSSSPSRKLYAPKKLEKGTKLVPLNEPTLAPGDVANLSPTRRSARPTGERSPTRQASPTRKASPVRQKSPTKPKTARQLAGIDTKATISKSMDLTDENVPLSTSPIKQRASRGFKRKIVAESIQLQELPEEEDTPPKIENAEADSDDDYEYKDITAGELLHNPRDLKVDNRPILTSAKTLADATKENSKKRKAPLKASNKKKVKQEAPSEGLDIMSRLAKAKQQAKDNVIVID